MNPALKLYLAGPLFTCAERSFNRRLAEFLGSRGCDVWLPQAKEPRERTARAIFELDREGVDWADVVLACMDGPDPDSGTSWECGYAAGRGKPVLQYRSDFRASDEAGLAPYNLMLSESALHRVEAPFVDEADLFEKVAAMVAAFDEDRRS